MIFCASKISNNGVKLNVPKDLKPQITDIAKKGDLQGFKTEEVVNEILKRDPNIEIIGVYCTSNLMSKILGAVQKREE